MRKTFLFLAALLTATVMNLQAADPVSYLYPVYNTSGDPTSGIKEWKTGSCTEYTVVAGSSSAVTWNAGWYVVNGADVAITKAITCSGAVHLILADGAKLTASKGIIVYGDANSIVIYGQSEQTGQLSVTGASSSGIGGYSSNTNAGAITINGGIITCTGANRQAGIGGGSNVTDGGFGKNITINGGTVTATGGTAAAGIGGGMNGTGSNITINGGTVTATGGTGIAGIGKGGGKSAADASNIFVNPSLILKADYTNPPTTVIAHATITTDVASSLAGKCYVTVTPTPMITGVTLTGFNAAYDGENHSVQVSGTIAGDVIEFSADSATWSATNPSFKGVVDTLIYVRVQRASYQDWGGKATIKITPKEINVTGTNVELKEYDGTTTASFNNEGELEGVIAGDDVTVSATGEFEDKNAGEDKDVTVTYTLSGTDAPNYILKSASTTLPGIGMIFAKNVFVEGTSVESKIYDGNTNATVNAGEMDYVVEGDDVTVSATGEYEDANVGDDKKITFNHTLIGTDATNYNLMNETEEQWSGIIFARAITMTSASDSKQFDGDPLTNATITFSGDGFVGSDTVSCTVTGSQTAVGSSPNSFTYTFSGSSEDNYAFTKVEGTLEVTAAPGPVVETYGRKVKSGKFGTICLSKKITAMEGVEGLYQPYEVQNDELYCEKVELTDVVAGGAYLFKANADSVTFTLDGEAVTEPATGNNMKGWLSATYVLNASDVQSSGDFYNYYLLGTKDNVQQLFITVEGSTIKQNCAAIKLPEEAPTAPARGHLISLGVNGKTTPTGVIDVNATRMSDVHKFVYNGQLVIIREGRKFNAQGQEL